MFWLALMVFLSSHMVVARPAVRRRLVGWLGEPRYLMAYSALSLVLLGLLIVAAQQAPRTEWWYMDALRWLPNLFMPVACMLLIMGFMVPNPLSIGRGSLVAMPTPLPLTLALTRHPVLWAFFLWAFSHGAANGEYPLAVMFGVFALLAGGGFALLDRKKKRLLGPLWATYASPTRVMLGASPALWKGRFRVTMADGIGACAGLGLYALLFWLHPMLFGVSPAPLWP